MPEVVDQLERRDVLANVDLDPRIAPVQFLQVGELPLEIQRLSVLRLVRGHGQDAQRALHEQWLGLYGHHRLPYQRRPLGLSQETESLLIVHQLPRQARELRDPGIVQSHLQSNTLPWTAALREVDSHSLREQGLVQFATH